MRSQKQSDIWFKNQLSDPQKNQISDITPPKKSNIRYQPTPYPPPPPPLVSFSMTGSLFIQSSNLPIHQYIS